MSEHYLYEDKLQSTRLMTRFTKPSDAAWWAPFFQDAQVHQFFPGTDLRDPMLQAREWMQRLQVRYREGLYGFQMLKRRKDNRRIGLCGLLLQEVDGIQELEVGYSLLPQYRGMGYATEAALLFLNYGFQHTNRDSLISIIHKENKASQGVALKNGLRPEKESLFKDIPAIIYRMTRDDWEKRNQNP